MDIKMKTETELDLGDEFTSWAVCYAVEQIETNGVTGSPSKAEIMSDGRLKVEWWWGTDESPLGGTTLSESEGGSDREYILTWPDAKAVKNATLTMQDNRDLIQAVIQNRLQNAFGDGQNEEMATAGKVDIGPNVYGMSREELVTELGYDSYEAWRISVEDASEDEFHRTDSEPDDLYTLDIDLDGSSPKNTRDEVIKRIILVETDMIPDETSPVAACAYTEHGPGGGNPNVRMEGTRDQIAETMRRIYGLQGDPETWPEPHLEDFDSMVPLVRKDPPKEDPYYAKIHDLAVNELIDLVCDVVNPLEGGFSITSIERGERLIVRFEGIDESKLPPEPYEGFCEFDGTTWSGQYGPVGGNEPEGILQLVLSEDFRPGLESAGDYLRKQAVYLTEMARLLDSQGPDEPQKLSRALLGDWRLTPYRG